MAWHTAAATILAEDGIGGMYRGFVPNALKNLPNKGACVRAGAWLWVRREPTTSGFAGQLALQVRAEGWLARRLPHCCRGRSPTHPLHLPSYMCRRQAVCV